MRWTERQRAMLREMGVRLWLREGVEDVVQAEPAATALAATGAGARLDRGALASPPAPLQQARPASAVERAPAHAARSADAASLAHGAPRLPGLAPADWLVVGEPLDATDAQAQQLLENMLAAIGVGLIAPDRARRAVFCGLPGAAPNAGVPEAALSSALATVAPRCVLAFGRAAAAALLGADAPLGGLRGRVHSHAGVPVVVTFPLVYLLRHPAEKAKAWADLCLAVRAGSAAGA